MRDPERLTLVVLVDVEPGGVAAFQRYEAVVLPLLERHAGRLERRLRTADGCAEVHIVSFGSRAGYESFVADPERAEHRGLLGDPPWSQRVLEVVEVQDA